MLNYERNGPEIIGHPRCWFGGAGLLVLLLGSCTCLGLIGNVERGGGPHSGTGLRVWAAAVLVGLLCGVVGLVRGERPMAVPILAVTFNSLPLLLYAVLWVLPKL